MDMGQMADMQMEMPAESAEETIPRQPSERLAEMEHDAGATALDQLLEPCSHCLNHSQLPLGSGTLREAEAQQRRTDAITPELAPLSALITLPGLIFDPRDHAPPGNSSSRYLLINIFRI
jgi:hypothetical protein